MKMAIWQKGEGEKRNKRNEKRKRKATNVSKKR